MKGIKSRWDRIIIKYVLKNLPNLIYTSYINLNVYYVCTCYIGTLKLFGLIVEFYNTCN